MLVLGRAGLGGGLRPICIGSLLQETAFLGWAATLESDRAGMATEAAGQLLSLAAGATSIAGGGWVVGAGRGCGQMGDILRNRMAGTNIGDTNVRCFAGFAESIVARIEVLAFLD